MKKDKSLRFERIKKKVLEQLRSGKWLHDKDGAFTPLLNSFQIAALEADQDNQSDDAGRSSANRKNGQGR
jgi:putative transposase